MSSPTRHASMRPVYNWHIMFNALPPFSALLLLASSVPFVQHDGRSRFSAAQTICGVVLPRALTRYRLAVETKYGRIECQLGTRDKAHIDDHGIAIITMRKDGIADTSIVAHELMHLWLGTRGWNLSERFIVPGVPTMPEGEEQAVDDTFAGLEEYLEHRMFVPILQRAGISDEQEQAGFLLLEEEREGSAEPFPPTLLGAIYLDLALRNRIVGEQYAGFLRRTGRTRALDAARAMQEIIDKDNPETQAQALKAERDCLNKVFGEDSPYLRLIP